MKNNITAPPQDSFLPKYKDRKLNAIKLQQEGKTIPEIAGSLNVSIRTVQRYFKNDFEDISSHRKAPGNQYKLTKDQLNQVKLIISKSAKKSSFLFSEWTPRMLVQYVQDEFDISISKEKARQILKYNIRQPKCSDVQLNKKIESWKEVKTKDVWILGHLYLGTQNRDGKFKSGKKPYVDDDLLKTLAEIERDKIDLSKKSMPQIALCVIGLQIKRVSCTFLEPSIDEKEQVEAFIIKVIENSKKRNIVLLTTKSSIVGRNAETLRYLSTKKNVHLEFLPYNSKVFYPIQVFKNSIMKDFSLFDHKHLHGIRMRSSRASEFKKTTRDKLSNHFKKISHF